jgi:hypothetical protein
METLTSLRQFIPVLDQLGIDGVSSDEGEDTENSSASPADHQFEVLEPQWRDPTVGTFFQKVDALHEYTRIFADKFGMRFTPGAPPRTRIRKGRKSETTKYPRGIHFNLYRAEWLEEQEPGWRKGGQGFVNEIIRPNKMRKNLIFPAELDE